MNIYKLEHQYSRSHKFYGVRTTLTLHELNVLCAYLSLLHFELPRIDGAEDTIAEDNGEELLKTIFNAESVYEEGKYSQTLDFMITGMNTVAAVWVNICMRLFRLPDQMRTKNCCKI